MPILTLAAAALAACPAPTVHDGDTIRCGREKIRIANIEAPELPDSPKCHPVRARAWCDYAVAARSRDALAAFLSTGPVTIERQGIDRYGRTLARVYANGRDAGAHLIARGLARSWD